MKTLEGIIAAAVTPVTQEHEVAEDHVAEFLAVLASRGCHGALLLGTTGEGPSFSLQQRQRIFLAAAEYRKDHPDFILLAGTGLPALQDTIEQTRFALECGFDGVVVLPPYYFKSPGRSGLYNWYRTILEEAVPAGKWLLGYHFPRMSGVPLELELLQDLAADFPGRFAGIKDSSGDPDHLLRLRAEMPEEFAVFAGNDRLLSAALEAGAAGTISSLANLASPLSRQIWDAYHNGEPYAHIQEDLSQVRAILDQHPPAPAFLKALLPRLLPLPHWQVYPPLSAAAPGAANDMLAQLRSGPTFDWRTVIDD